MNFVKILGILLVNLLISVPTYATVQEEKDVKFVPDTNILMKGGAQMALEVIAPDKLNETYPELFYLDSLAFSQEPNIKLVISKSAYIVNKPAGFFDQEKMKSESYLASMMGEQKIKKFSEGMFKVSVPGEHPYSFVMKTYFDSDDISTLPNSKVIRAVTQARKMDVLAGGAPSTVFKEMTKFSKYSVGAVEVTSYIALKENKTMVIRYAFSGVKKFYALSKLLKFNLKQEIEFQQKTLNSLP